MIERLRVLEPKMILVLDTINRKTAFFIEIACSDIFALRYNPRNGIAITDEPALRSAYELFTVAFAARGAIYSEQADVSASTFLAYGHETSD